VRSGPKPYFTLTAAAPLVMALRCAAAALSPSHNQVVGVGGVHQERLTHHTTWRRVCSCLYTLQLLQ
jgi:hypothetical protein